MERGPGEVAQPEPLGIVRGKGQARIDGARVILEHGLHRVEVVAAVDAERATLLPEQAQLARDQLRHLGAAPERGRRAKQAADRGEAKQTERARSLV